MDMRATALQLALQSKREHDRPAEVIAAAVLYFDFLRGAGPAPKVKPPKAKKR